MKKIMIASLALAALSLAACSSDDNDYREARHFDDTTVPSVVSVSPEDNSTDIDTIENVVITYSKPVTLTPHRTVRIYTNDSTYYYAADSTVTCEGNQVTINVNAQPAQYYKIEVMKPTVRDSSYNFAEDYSFSFQTKVYNMFDATKFNITPDLVNANATAETKALYSYLVSQFGKTVLSAATANNAGMNHDMADYIYQASGKYPAINTYDFIQFIHSKPLNPTNWMDYTNTQEEEDWHNAGGIVSFMWHWVVPKTKAQESDYDKGYTFKADETDWDAKQATRTGTWQHTHAMRDIDIIADYLLALQQKGIAVIWRPLHEASGNIYNYDNGQPWFWWGKGGAANFKKLWRMVFNEFKAKGVNNVIWVWTSEGNDKNFYPGDNYVDIIAYDYYENNKSLYHSSAADKFEALREMTGGKKIITMAECGAMPSVKSMMEKGTVWSWVMPWYGDYTTGGDINSKEFFNSWMNSKFVVTRDQVNY